MSGKTKKKEEVVVKDVLGNELRKEEEEEKCTGCTDHVEGFPFGMTISEENGAKSKETNSPNFHRHHEKLSKKIQELCEATKKNNVRIDFLISLIPEDILKEAVKRFIKVNEQKIKFVEAGDKLTKLQKDLKLIGIYHSY